MSRPDVRYLLSGKIHGARVTDADIAYEGSVSVDPDLLDAAGIVEYEQVHLLSLESGERLITYAISSERGSGSVCVNGAAAHRIGVGERVIVISYGAFADEKVGQHVPAVVRVDESNHILWDRSQLTVDEATTLN